MLRVAERELMNDPGDPAWLEVAIIRADVREELAGPFAKALAAHGAPVPNQEAAVGFLVRTEAEEGLRSGADPVEVATSLVSRFFLTYLGTTVPAHLQRLYEHLDDRVPSPQYEDQIREELRRLAVGEPATVQVGPYWYERP